MDKRDERPVELIGIQRETTLLFELPERAVRALAIIADFGEDALEKCVATVLSPGVARTHSYGLRDVQKMGNVAREALRRLEDARAVADGCKVAVDRPLKAVG